MGIDSCIDFSCRRNYSFFDRKRNSVVLNQAKQHFENKIKLTATSTHRSVSPPMTDKEMILDRLERFCLSMNSFANNDFALLVSETAITPGVDDFCKTVNSRFVHSKLCCNTHTYLQEISLSDPFEILVRQFVQQQHQSIGTVSGRCSCVKWMFLLYCGLLYLLWNTHSFVF